MSRRDCPACWGRNTLSGMLEPGSTLSCSDCHEDFHVDAYGGVRPGARLRAPSRLLRIILTGLVLIPLAFVIVGQLGCASIESSAEGWLPQPVHAPLKPEFVVVERGQLPRFCCKPNRPCYPGLQLHGCTVREPWNGRALIYTEVNPPEWLKRHELRHAAGEDHAHPSASAMVTR